MNTERSMTTVVRVRENGVDVIYSPQYIEESGMYSVIIPGLDLYFSVSDLSQIDTKATAILTAFFNYWIKDQGYKKFIIELHKLGFKSIKHDLVMKQLLSGVRVKADFDFSPRIKKGASSHVLDQRKAELANV